MSNLHSVSGYPQDNRYDGTGVGASRRMSASWNKRSRVAFKLKMRRAWL